MTAFEVWMLGHRRSNDKCVGSFPTLEQARALWRSPTEDLKGPLEIRDTEGVVVVAAIDSPMRSTRQTMKAPTLPKE